MSPKYGTPLTIEHALLGFLQDGPLHGYEIHQRLQTAQALGLVWRLKQAHLYALLGKLEDAELLEPASSDVPGTLSPDIMVRGRARRPLALTPTGARAFQVWIHRPVRHGRDLRIEFLAKLFWAQREGLTAASQLVQQQRLVCQSWLAELEAEVELFANHDFYQRLVLLFRKGQVEAMLDWLDTCASMLTDTTRPT